MDALTPDQQALRSKILFGAVIWGVAAGLIVALLMFWLLANAGDVLRWLVSLGLGGGAGYLAYRGSFNAGVAKSICRNCGTAFGIREVERAERLVGTEQRSKVERVKPASKIDAPQTRTTTWTEETYEVTAVDECFKCGNRTERKWTVTREANKSEATT